MKSIIVFAWICLIASFNSYADVTINTTCYDGIAPLAIDGDLSDWEFTNVLFFPIKDINSLSKTGKPRSDIDLSASFNCIFDRENMYIGIKVIDDKIVMGEESIGRPFWDDCVELLLYGDKTGDSPLKIWVSADKDGKVKLEGREPKEKKSYPFLWQKEGVISAIKKNIEGYGVEIMIPPNVLSIIGSDKKFVRMNVVIYDDDDGYDFDAIIQLVESENKGASFNISNMNVGGENNIITKGNIVVDLNLNTKDVIESDYDSVFEISEIFRSNMMYVESIEELMKLLKNEDEHIKTKAKLYLARNYYFKREYNDARAYCLEVMSNDPESILSLEAEMIVYTIEVNKQ